MTHLNELYLILNKYLKWNKSHLKCFALIMLVIILKQTCNLSSASKALPIKCLPQSFYRRMQRFFAGQYFDYRQISRLIFNMFSFDQVQLTLDRTIKLVIYFAILKLVKLNVVNDGFWLVG